jgi:hypothetical protein
MLLLCQAQAKFGAAGLTLSQCGFFCVLFFVCLALSLSALMCLCCMFGVRELMHERYLLALILQYCMQYPVCVADDIHMVCQHHAVRRATGSTSLRMSFMVLQWNLCVFILKLWWFEH